MSSNHPFVAAIVLAGALGIAASGCYTILAVDDSPQIAEPISFECEPIIIIVTPPPPPPPPPSVWQPDPIVTTPLAPVAEKPHRTSGPDRSGDVPSSAPPASGRRPIRTGRGS